MTHVPYLFRNAAFRPVLGNHMYEFDSNQEVLE